MVTRAIQNLPIAPLELSTITIITWSVSTFFLWFDKPLNILTPTTLTLTLSILISQILKGRG
ncbi:hypothetical protein K469DRAFT_708279 [Zopfia rhizophila CBS 207.26]|uniref:Uncharacterized protein n=1 Tax=Zopfia rhizophila CBS 207.26 TaxID=1314779 RepID=A0A6A6E3D5_9PEZI|nr:hypothetical protein K469DRAFT_708279 [Zopfia rhizophila CBS 207.26]